MIKCACGCGQEITKQGNKYIFSHNSRTKLYWEKQLPEFIECKCGCGQKILSTNKWGYKSKFVSGHNRRKKPFRNEWETVFCTCGCGIEISKFTIRGDLRKYVDASHALRKSRYKRINSSEMIQCACGCGEYKNRFDRNGKEHRFIVGHNVRCMSDKTKQKIALAHIGRSSGMLGKVPSFETRQKISEKRKGHSVSFETRQKISQAHKGKKLSDEHILKMVLCRKGKKLSKEHKRKIFMSCPRGEKSPHWKGGVSKEPYCQEWDKWLKEQIKERDNFKCQNLGCSYINVVLCIHHIDYNKKNCSVDNLITLCRHCNTRANYNRDYWQEFYNKLMGNGGNKYDN